MNANKFWFGLYQLIQKLLLWRKTNNRNGAHTNACTHCTHMHAHTAHTCMHTLHVHTAYMHAHTHSCTHIHTCMHICMHTHIHTCTQRICKNCCSRQKLHMAMSGRTSPPLMNQLAILLYIRFFPMLHCPFDDANNPKSGEKCMSPSFCRHLPICFWCIWCYYTLTRA